MLGGRTWDQWIAQYGGSHQHPINRLCHTLGIPLIALSLPLFLVALVVRGLWPLPTILFVLGRALQCVGHAFEGKPPSSFTTGAFCWSAWVVGREDAWTRVSRSSGPALW